MGKQVNEGCYRHARSHESDLRLPAYDDFELMEAAIGLGHALSSSKTHRGTTMDRMRICATATARLCEKTNNFTMFGSITLNKVVSINRRQSCGTSHRSKGGMASDPVGEEPYAEDEPGSEPERGGRKDGKIVRSFVPCWNDPRPQCGTGNRSSHRRRFSSCKSCTGYRNKKHRCNPS